MTSEGEQSTRPHLSELVDVWECKRLLKQGHTISAETGKITSTPIIYKTLPEPTTYTDLKVSQSNEIVITSPSRTVKRSVRFDKTIANLIEAKGICIGFDKFSETLDNFSEAWPWLITVAILDADAKQINIASNKDLSSKFDIARDNSVKAYSRATPPPMTFILQWSDKAVWEKDGGTGSLTGHKEDLPAPNKKGTLVERILGFMYTE